VLTAALTGLVLAFVTAAAVLHTAASGNAALTYQTGRTCAGLLPVSLDTLPLHHTATEHITTTARQHATRHGFDEPQISRYLLVRRVDFDGTAPWLRLAHRPDVADHLTVLEGGDRTGLWIPRSVAEAAGIRLGDRGMNGLLPPVTAIYEDLTTPTDDWWCSEERHVVSNLLAAEGSTAPAGFILDATDFDHLVTTTEQPVTTTIRFPTTPPTTVSQAQDLAARTQALLADLDHDLAPTPLAKSVIRTDHISRPTTLAEQAHRTVLLAVLPLTTTTALVGLIAVAAVAVQWCQRRHREIRLLWVRGVSPSAIGGKAALELAAPLLLGTTAGLLLARSLLAGYAPGTRLEPGDTLTATTVVAGLLVAALIVLATTVTLYVRRTWQSRGPARTPRLARLLATLPWELATAALAVWAWTRLDHGALTVEHGEVLPRIDPLALAFPLLVVLTAAGLGARLLTAALTASHRLTLWTRPALHLAVRRLAAARTTAAAVLAVTVLAVGTLTAGHTITRAQQDALTAKSGLATGAESVVQLDEDTVRNPQQLPPEVAATSTLVGRTEIDIQRTSYIVLAVDPHTFAQVAWTPPDTATTLHSLLARLATPTGDTIPAIRVGNAPDGDLTGAGLHLNTIGTVHRFPGLAKQAGYVIPSTAITDPDLLPVWTLWSTTDLPTLTRHLTAAGVDYINPQARDRTLDGLPFLAVIWTFDFITTLGVVLAVLAAGALLLVVEVRRRSNAVTSTLAARMGLRPRTLTASYLIELVTVTGPAALLGIAAGAGAGALSVTRIDPAPRLAPTPGPPDLLPFLLGATTLTAAAVLITTALAVRSVRAVNVGELLHD